MPFRWFFPYFIFILFFWFYGEIWPHRPAKNPREAPRNDLQDLRDAIERAEEAVSASSSDSALESDVLFKVYSFQKTTSGSELSLSQISPGWRVGKRSEEWDFVGIFDRNFMVIDPCSLLFLIFTPFQWKSFFILFFLVSEKRLESSLLFGPSKGLSKIWPNSFPAAVAQPPLFTGDRKGNPSEFSFKWSSGILGRWTKNRTLSLF